MHIPTKTQTLKLDPQSVSFALTILENMCRSDLASLSMSQEELIRIILPFI